MSGLRKMIDCKELRNRLYKEFEEDHLRDKHEYTRKSQIHPNGEITVTYEVFASPKMSERLWSLLWEEVVDASYEEFESDRDAAKFRSEYMDFEVVTLRKNKRVKVTRARKMEFSPVIAAMMLIGLAVACGAMTAMILLPLLGVP